MADFMLTEEVINEWSDVINAKDLPEIKDVTIRNHTIQVLENQKNFMAEGSETPAIANFDPVLIGMVRRTMPSMIANNLVGVQPMSGPTGLVFVLKAWYGGTQSGTEAFTTTEPDKAHSGPMTTNAAEKLGVDFNVAGGAGDPVNDPVVQTNPWKEMSFSIESVTVQPETRALKAKFTRELATDLRKIHGMDAESLLADILSTEIVAEMNRELIFDLNTMAEVGAQNATVPGTFDMDADADGRWLVEKYKALLVQINKESAQIALRARRGLANWIVTTAEVAGALDMASRIDSTFTMNSNLGGDGLGITYAGKLLGRFDVYIDAYAAANYILIGYKGANQFDSGYFIAPYVPLEMMRAIGEEDFQPRIGFKTRYGRVANPLTSGGAASNVYYRRFLITNL
jgi:hypothetical protein